MKEAVVGTLLFALGIAFGYYFLRPVISAREAKQAAFQIQLRCEDRFAKYPREKGKKLVEGIKKCREVAGLSTEAKNDSSSY